MRTLERNKVALWLVNPTGFADTIGTDGLYTGDVTRTFSVPVTVRIMLYPATGSIRENIFGHEVDIDMVSVSTDVVFTIDSLLFETSPSGNYFETYTYKVTNIMKSLTGYMYGLKRRK